MLGFAAAPDRAIFNRQRMDQDRAPTDVNQFQTFLDSYQFKHVSFPPTRSTQIRTDDRSPTYGVWKSLTLADEVVSQSVSC